MSKFSAKRRRIARRRADGTFRAWPGGYTKTNMPHARGGQQGISVHIAAEFRKDHGRAPKVGDIHRTRTSTGAFHRAAYWYVLTPHGWRRAASETRRPTPAEIKAIVNHSQPGRPYRKRGT